MFPILSMMNEFEMNESLGWHIATGLDGVVDELSNGIDRTYEIISGKRIQTAVYLTQKMRSS